MNSPPSPPTNANEAGIILITSRTFRGKYPIRGDYLDTMKRYISTSNHFILFHLIPFHCRSKFKFITLVRYLRISFFFFNLRFNIHHRQITRKISHDDLSRNLLFDEACEMERFDTNNINNNYSISAIILSS